MDRTITYIDIATIYGKVSSTVMRKLKKANLVSDGEKLKYSKLPKYLAHLDLFWERAVGVEDVVPYISTAQPETVHNGVIVTVDPDPIDVQVTGKFRTFEAGENEGTEAMEQQIQAYKEHAGKACLSLGNMLAQLAQEELYQEIEQLKQKVRQGFAESMNLVDPK